MLPVKVDQNWMLSYGCSMYKLTKFLFVFYSLRLHVGLSEKYTVIYLPTYLISPDH